MAVRQSHHIDPELLERMARIARGFPGRTVEIVGSVGRAQSEPREDPQRQRSARPGGVAQREPTVTVDGVTVDEIVAGYELG
jgi:hypothetical protein